MQDKIVDKFIDAVTRDMGWRQRIEVKRELRAHILDSSEALAAERKVPVDEAIVKEVMAKMGSPADIAAMYPARKVVLAGLTLDDCILVIFGLVFLIVLTLGCAFLLRMGWGL